MGLSGYYRHFIRNFSQLAAPLTQLLCKDGFAWSTHAQSAFDVLKQALTQAPILTLPDFTLPFVLETDASGDGIGAVLSQNKHLIAFFSKKLSPRMRAQSVYARELYAITEAVAKFRHYLLGHHFIIRIDHASLRHLTDQVLQTPEQEACLPKLMGYRFSIEYRPGKTNAAADALSRVSLMALSSTSHTFMDTLYDTLHSSPLIQKLHDQIITNPASLPLYSIRQGSVYWRN